MSFVHCPTCQRAYNLVGQAACPNCGVRAGAPADPTEDIIVAADQLARAVARATPAQLAAADLTLRMRTRQLALPSGQRPDHSAPPELLRAVRQALLPAPEPTPKRTLSSVARAWLADRAAAWSTRARGLLARV